MRISRNRPLRLGVGFLIAAASAATGALADTGTAAASASSATPAAHVWVTTADGTDKLSDLGTVDFTTAPTSVQTVVVDPTQTFQTMTGFGASITDASASVLYTLPAAQRAQVMASLFSPYGGDGLDYLRQPIGGTDMVSTATGPYTYDDLPAGQTDYALAHFSVAHDEAQILPLLREAERLNPNLQIMASPWSPPAWMKDSDSLLSGRLIASPQIYHAYALYLLEFLEAYRAQGVNVDAITIQNEPQNRHSDTYPGTDMPSWQEAAVIEDLGPMLKAAHLHTEIFGYDHNWTEASGDVSGTPADETGDIDDYPQQLLDTPAAQWISGIAFHCYSGDPSAMTAFHQQYPKLKIEETECSGSESADPADTFSDTLKWHARNLEIGSTRNWSSTVVNWDLALNQDNGPHVGGCATCTGVVTVGPGDTVTDNAEYYALGQLSRFVQPGAVRIGSTSFGTTGWNGDIMDVAFRNPDGQTVLVAHNENDDPQTFAVQEGAWRLTYTLPGDSLATFVWNADLAGAHPLRQVDPTGWSATANPPAPTNSCCTGDVAADAVDADASTRYSTGEGQAPGQYLQVDFGKPVRARQVVFDTGASTGDYPRGYAVQTSTDGTNWTTAVAAGVGTGQFTTVNLDGAPVRYVRITLTATDANDWWSVADVRAYVG
ncbi:discoidin domain-containing protein [Actinospica durhamensis]|uniref:Discoidin domain-containing protein n=1 Tax=Actinospica durhamensis TaxID=1508375 RepID=A0A941EHI7_9ACTN|nr:discoidin domain-containing protein [Actinospica durhamensis]MBR7832700.1 discoidin domain-containing protein [Actinospica durhamensis]